MASSNTQTAEHMTNDMHGMDDATSQFLTFMLAGESYGVDILRVQEIKGWASVTEIPNTPDYMRGVLNLRGAVIPIVDMRLRFDMPEQEYTATTVIIVLSVKAASGDRVIGIVVDAVSDVMDVDLDNIKETPDFGESVNTEFLNGLATVDDRMIMLLDVDLLLDVDKLATQQVEEQAAEVESAD